VPAALVKEIENEFGQIQKGGVLLNQEILLASGNRNRGASLASSEIVAFFDADDLPHPRLFEVVSFMFENYDIVHLNHCTALNELPNTPIGQIRTVDSSTLYPAYFPNADFSQCIDIVGSYGAGLPADFSCVAAGHTYVRREVLNTVSWKEPRDRVFRMGEDYEFCMEVLFRFKKSLIINSVLSQFRPSTARGKDRHGYKNAKYIDVQDA